jgi:hypothetical protein
MLRITSKILNEDILFLGALEKRENIENKDNLVVYNYAEQYLIKELKPSPEDLIFMHKLKKEFEGVIERRDYVSRSSERKYFKNEFGTRVEDECSAESAFDATKSISISTDVFEFFKDYRKFRETLS